MIIGKTCQNRDTFDTFSENIGDFPIQETISLKKDNSIQNELPKTKEFLVKKELQIKKELPIEKEFLTKQELPTKKEISTEEELPIKKEISAKKELPRNKESSTKKQKTKNKNQRNLQYKANNRKVFKPDERFGIQNIGNTCYMNSLFQALYPLKEFQIFINWINDKFEEDNLEKSVNEWGTNEKDSARLFVNAYKAVLGYAQSMDDIKLFYSNLCKEFTTPRRQEDSHRLLIHIFEALDGVIEEDPISEEDWCQMSTKSSSMGSSPKSENKEDSFIDETQPFNEESKVVSSYIDSIPNKSVSAKFLKNPFRGVYKSVMKCHSWGEEFGETDESSNVLSLAWDKNTVEENLIQMFQTETMEGYPCFRWKLLLTAEKYKGILKNCHKKDPLKSKFEGF